MGVPKPICNPRSAYDAIKTFIWRRFNQEKYVDAVIPVHKTNKSMFRVHTRTLQLRRQQLLGTEKNQ